MDLRLALPVARSTAEAIVGRTGKLFSSDSVSHRAVFTLDADVKVPRSVQLLTSREPRDVIVRLGTSDTGPSAIRTIALKFTDAYGPGRDQDFLLASSGDGAPLHHVTLPVAAGQQTLYSSLWLYLAGVVPTLFGVRTDGSDFVEGDVAEFCISPPVGRFRRVGTITLKGRIDAAADWTFAARHTGGNIRPLPPVSFY